MWSNLTDKTKIEYKISKLGIREIIQKWNEFDDVWCKLFIKYDSLYFMDKKGFEFSITCIDKIQKISLDSKVKKIDIVSKEYGAFSSNHCAITKDKFIHY